MKIKARLAVDRYWSSDVSYPGVGSEGWNKQYVWITEEGHWDFSAATKYDGKYITLRRYPGPFWTHRSLGKITYVKKDKRYINALIQSEAKRDFYWRGSL